MKVFVKFFKVNKIIVKSCPYVCPVCGALDSMTEIDGECYCLECNSFVD